MIRGGSWVLNATGKTYLTWFRRGLILEVPS